MDTKHDNQSTHQILKDAFVQLPLFWPALPQLLVVVVEALPMRTERLQAALVDVVNAAHFPPGSALLPVRPSA